jgi:hypothetical protein
VVAAEISTRDLVQEYLANKTFPTSSGWGMPKKKDGGKKYELVRLPYHFKFEKQFKKPCNEWLEMIETMCNEILGNYTKKEDQLMTAAFGTRPKRRLNRVMDTLNFDYPDYEKLNEGGEGIKRKRILSILSRQAARLIKEDEKSLKKPRTAQEPKMAISKKQKLCIVPSSKPKAGEGAPSTPSAAEVAEILKVMTDSPPFKLLRPLGSELTKLLQKRVQPSAVEDKVKEQKKRRIVNVMQAIERTLPSASAAKTVTTTGAEAKAAIEAKDAGEAKATMSDIDRLISYVVKDVTAEEDLATAPDKERETDIGPSGEEDFDLRHLGGQELSEEEKLELKEFAMSCGYQPGAWPFGGVDEEILGCICDCTRAKIVGTLSKSVVFLKLETNISCYRRQHIVSSLFYSNFKVRSLTKLLLLSLW